MMIDVDDVTENFKGRKTWRNKINNLENNLRLRNVRLENNLDRVEVRETVTFLPSTPHIGHCRTALDE